MSGTKAFAVTAGVSPAATIGALAAGAAVVGVAASGVIAVGAVATMVGSAAQAYQERSRRQREAAIQKEQAIQQRIAQIKARSRSHASQSRVTVKLPQSATKAKTLTSPQLDPATKDAQKRVAELKSRLPKVQAEYQSLIDQQLIDRQTVQQALQQTEQALNANNLAGAEAYLQALDDARIQVMAQLRSQWTSQIEYLQERLNAAVDRFPQSITQQLQTRIDNFRTHWQQLKDADIETLHQEISILEAQAQQIQELADNILHSWLQVGYPARIIAIDDGDVVLEVETHEGVNTQMRVQFDGQQINLFGPPEETDSCAARTVEAMRLFQEQGYQLEWDSLDGQPVPEEWRYLYSAAPTEVAIVEDAEELGSDTYMRSPSQRRLESQGY